MSSAAGSASTELPSGMRYAAFLRGINVGGNKKVPMADLRAVVERLEHTDVATLLQSGNVVFSSPRKGDVALAAELERAIAEHIGVECRVLVRSAAALQTVVRDNPMPDALAEPSKFHCCFLEKAPPADRVAALEAEDFTPDELAFGDGVLYVWYRAGVHESKLAKVLDRRLGVAVTARNWNTVTKVLDKLGSS